MKVVINTCFGGFGLSKAAVKRLADLQGRPCYFFGTNEVNGPYIPIDEVDRPFLWCAFDIANPNEVLAPQKNWYAMTDDEKRVQNELFSKHHLDCRPDDRSSPLLVRVVEELGSEANGEHAELAVVEIPDGIEWEIDEYDGTEHIAERHRTWG